MGKSPLPVSLRALLAAALLAGASAAPANVPFPTREGLPSLAPLLRGVTPAVVNISVLSSPAAPENPLRRDPFFRRFFDEFLERVPSRPQQSVGSGVVVDAAKGYVLTNRHVIENAREIHVTLEDGRRFQATRVGDDPGTDIALLKIEAKGLTAVRFGDSNALEVGDFVIAIGNPFGLGQTVTSGIVSALGRSGLSLEGYEDFIQTDASINPGNSGGALINLRGELVGVNTAIIGPAGGNVGIGFAVPSNMVKAVMAHLVEYGEVRRGRLGVRIQDVTAELAEALGLESARGALITRVEPGSSAEQAGLRAGDVVILVGGRAVEDSADLRNYVGLLRIGDDVHMTIMREGAQLNLVAKVADIDSVSFTADDTAPQIAGALFQDMTESHPLYGRVEGVVVASVESGSTAWQNGLRPDDIIIAVNRTPVGSVAALEAVLAQPTRAMALDIVRGNTRLFLVIQ
ncbi:MAG: DegQ family serine endoprotease [Gammaproteobacteria bacterium]|nr:DegQ family serine endoprotease [Gammaproteobacteria bacterium]